MIHADRIAEGGKPDIVANLVAAAQAVAQLDLRPDIDRYADGGETVVLPDTLFDGCLASNGDTPGLRIAPGLSGEALAVCGRRIAGL